MKFLEKISGAQISAIGIGPGRDETIVIRDFVFPEIFTQSR